MSQENVEVVRTWLAPWDGVDAVAVFRDDATWTRSRAEFEAFFESDYAIAWIAQGQRVLEASGWDDSRRGWLDWLEPWETYHVHIERIVPVADKVVVLTRLHGRMAATQKEVEMLGGSVYLVRDSRVARVQHYADRAEALEAAGVREQAMSQENARQAEVLRPLGPRASSRLLRKYWRTTRPGQPCGFECAWRAAVAFACPSLSAVPHRHVCPTRRPTARATARA